MIRALLKILQVLGIIVGILLALVIFLILLVLLVPIRYEAKGKKDEKDIWARYRISFLLRIISVSGSYQNKTLNMSVRIFGIPLKMGGKADTKKGRFRRKRSRKEAEDIDAEEIRINDGAPKDRVIEDPIIQENIKKNSHEDINKGVKETSTPKEDHPSGIPDGHGAKKEETSRKEKKGFFRKIKDIKISIARKIKSVISGIGRRIKTILQLKDNVVEFFKNEINKAALKEIKYRVKKVLKHILPKKVRINAVFGFEDPSYTGQVLGAAAMLYPVYKDNIKLHPDFEQAIFQGDFYLKGRIRLGTLFVHGVKLLLNKNVRRMIKNAKNITQIDTGKNA